MGLDMYLTADKYISTYSHSDEDTALRRAIAVAIGLPEDETDENTAGKVTGVSVRVAYWRKANQIHKWFVDNVQNGEDDCNKYFVNREQLDELRELCKRVFAKRYTKTHAKYAEKNLPTASGFFYGDVEYGEDYYADLSETISLLAPEKLNRYNDGFEFEYQASW